MPAARITEIDAEFFGPEGTQMMQPAAATVSRKRAPTARGQQGGREWASQPAHRNPEAGQ